MLSALSDATVDLFNHQSDEAKSKTLTVLATFANITKCMLGKEEFYSKLSNDTELLCEQVFENVSRICSNKISGDDWSNNPVRSRESNWCIR